MNSVQYINLLAIRGITQLNTGQTVGQAVERSGGNPSPDEMVEVNRLTMTHYLGKYLEQKTEIAQLKEENKKLTIRDNWLTCLESAGVDNWEGCGVADDIMKASPSN